LFKLNNKDLTFSVDVSKLPCGVHDALCFVQRDADDGDSKYSGAKPGAQYGLCDCDAQCASDLPFINGEANSDGWEPQSHDNNAGNGTYGSYCTEMDVCEANSEATAHSPPFSRRVVSNDAQKSQNVVGKMVRIDLWTL
jgi:cellulose 1,4-beta-cellobiosidase